MGLNSLLCWLVLSVVLSLSHQSASFISLSTACVTGSPCVVWNGRCSAEGSASGAASAGDRRACAAAAAAAGGSPAGPGA